MASADRPDNAKRPSLRPRDAKGGVAQPKWRQREREGYRSTKPRPQPVVRNCVSCRTEFIADGPFQRSCKSCRADRRISARGLAWTIAGCALLLLAGADPVRSQADKPEYRATTVVYPTAQEIALANMIRWQAASLSKSLSMDVCTVNANSSLVCHAIEPEIARLMLRIGIEVERQAIEDLNRKSKTERTR